MNLLPFCMARNLRIDNKDNLPMPRDTRAHSGIQPWSQGPLFPAVIARVERYHDARVAPHGGYSVSYELTIGAYCEDAEMVARYVCRDGKILPERYAELIADPEATLPRH